MTTYYLNRGYNIEKFKEICKAIEMLYPSYKKDKLMFDYEYQRYDINIKQKKFFKNLYNLGRIVNV